MKLFSRVVTVNFFAYSLIQTKAMSFLQRRKCDCTVASKNIGTIELRVFQDFFTSEMQAILRSIFLLSENLRNLDFADIVPVYSFG